MLLVGGSYTQHFVKAVDVYDSINVVKLDHYVFDSLSGWKESVSLKNPTIQLKASVDKQAYTQMNIICHRQNYCKINVVTDTSAQSCLWDLNSYLKHDFKKSNLLPIKLGIISRDFPRIGSTIESCIILEKCTYQLLQEMTGLPLKVHIDLDAIPKAISTFSPILKH